MLACVCRPVTSTLPKPPALSAPQKRPTSMVVTSEPRTTIDKRLNNNWIKTECPELNNNVQPNSEKTAPGRPNPSELKAMALRQQQQIDTQHQLLAAKEQRLRYLKNQEIRNAAAAAEGERLHRLRERVEAQESKLRRLRALRGQVDLQKTYNVTLSNDLDSIRALFSEKEKELSLAVAKVDALTKQLEEIRRDRRGPLNLINGPGTVTAASLNATNSVVTSNGLSINTTNNVGLNSNNGTSAARELDKLRRELMYRNQLSLQQDARLHLQREALHQRQAELRSVDQRIYELQSRLQKKKAANVAQTFQNQMKTNHRINHCDDPAQQQQSQQRPNSQFHPNSENINYTNNNGVVLQFFNINDNNNTNSTAASTNKPSHSVYPSQRIKGNVAAVEPYIHHMPQQKPNAVSVKKQQQQQQQQSHSIHAQHHQKLVQDLTNLKMSFHETANQKNPSNNNSNANVNVNVDHVQYVESDENKLARQMLHIKQHSQEYDTNVSADITDFVSSSSTTTTSTIANKSDSKFQTLPYGSAKTIAKNNVPTNMSNIPMTATTTLKTNCSTSSRESMDSSDTTSSKMHTIDDDEVDQSHQQHQSQSKQSQIGVMHKSAGQTMSFSASNGNHQRDKSMPKSKLATPTTTTTTTTHQIPSGNLVVPPRKPISSVAPTSITTTTQKSTIPSARVNAVAPNIINTQQSILSTVVASTTNDKSSRPALPPKPNKSSSDSNSNSSNSSTETSPTSNATTINRYRNASTSATAVAKSLLNASDKHTSNFESNLSNNNQQQQQQQQQQQSIIPVPVQNIDYFPIKAKPLTIKKQPLSEQPRLRSLTSGIKPIQYTSRRIEMPSSLLFPQIDKQMKTKIDNKQIMSSSSPMAVHDSKLQSASSSSNSSIDDSDKSVSSSVSSDTEKCITENNVQQQNGEIPRRQRSSLSDNTKVKLARRVSFDPLALLLDASLEGELELVQKTAMQVPNPSAANDEGITALHNAICAGHFDIVKFLVEFGCDVNAQDSDGWTPLHCAASCNNLSMVKFLVESGACLFASTLSDHETPAEKCEEDEEGFDGCSEYLYSIQEKLGIMNNGEVYAVFSYEAQQPDELTFEVNDQLTILRKGDDAEREWWWAKMMETGKEGYVPRNLLGLYARIPLQQPAE